MQILLSLTKKKQYLGMCPSVMFWVLSFWNSFVWQLLIEILYIIL